MKKIATVSAFCFCLSILIIAGATGPAVAGGGGGGGGANVDFTAMYTVETTTSIQYPTSSGSLSATCANDDVALSCTAACPYAAPIYGVLYAPLTIGAEVVYPYGYCPTSCGKGICGVDCVCCTVAESWSNRLPGFCQAYCQQSAATAIGAEFYPTSVQVVCVPRK